MFPATFATILCRSLSLSLSLSPHNNTWTPRHSITYLRTYIRQMKASLYCELVWESQRSHTHTLSLFLISSLTCLSLSCYILFHSPLIIRTLSLSFTHTISLSHTVPYRRRCCRCSAATTLDY